MQYAFLLSWHPYSLQNSPGLLGFHAEFVRIPVCSLVIKINGTHQLSNINRIAIHKVL